MYGEGRASALSEDGVNFCTIHTPHYENVPFEVPSGWVWTTLGSVCNFENGFAFSSDDYKQTGVPLIRISNISDNTIDLNGCVFIQKEIDDRFVVKKGDLLIALSGATTGKMGVYSTDKVAYLNQRVGNLRTIDTSVLCHEYRNIFMNSRAEAILKLAYGGAQPNISGSVICSFSFPLPPLAEQQRIASEVNHWFALIDQIEQGKSDLQTIIKQAKSKILNLAIHGKLVPQDPNDEPAIELLKRINPDFTPCDNGHYENLPDGWGVCRLEDIVDYEQPTAYIVNSTSYNDSYPIPVLTAGKSFIIGYTNEVKGIYSKLPCIIFDDFTTDSKFVDFPFKVKSSAMKILQVRKDVEVEYVAMFMSTTRLIGDTHKRYWISEYSKLTIPIPPKAEQKRIVDTVHTAFAKLDTIMESL